MRIVHVAFGLDVGGLEKLLLEFAGHANRERQRLLFVSLGANGAVGEQLRAEYRPHAAWPGLGIIAPTEMAGEDGGTGDIKIHLCLA